MIKIIYPLCSVQALPLTKTEHQALRVTWTCNVTTLRQENITVLQKQWSGHMRTAVFMLHNCTQVEIVSKKSILFPLRTPDFNNTFFVAEDAPSELCSRAAASCSPSTAQRSPPHAAQLFQQAENSWDRSQFISPITQHEKGSEWILVTAP